MNWNDENIQVIKDVKAGIVCLTRAAIKLDVHPITVKRKVLEYQEQGLKCFIHGNTGKTPANKKDFNKIKKVMEENFLEGCNFKYASKLLRNFTDIEISPSCLRLHMYNNGILSSKCNKKTRRRMKRKLKKKMEQSKKQTVFTKDEKLTLNALEMEEYVGKYTHPTKPRSKYFGERVELDAATQKIFVPGLGPMAIHVAVDDASGFILGLWLEKEETLNGYYKVMQQILTKYGIPVAIRTDKRTVFTYQKKGEGKIENDTFTQFAYAMSRLGSDLTCNSDPDSKPKVERMNQTLEGQLKYYFRMKNISTVEEANKCLQEEYIDDYNKEYGYATFIENGRSKTIASAFVPCTKDQVKNSLVWMFERVVNKGCTIKYNKKYYALYNKQSKQIALNKGTKITVIKTLDGELLASKDKGINYTLVEVPERYLFSKAVDLTEAKKPKIKYKPSSEHPWSYSSMEYFKKHSSMMRELYSN